MLQTTPKPNAFRSVIFEWVWSRSSKNYRYLGNEYYQLPYPLRECISDYYPFGSSLPTRSWSDASRAYRYGFSRQEKESEAGEIYSFEFRELNVRLCRFVSVDPLILKYPKWSPYAYAMNRPIDGIDIEGKEWCSQHKWGDVITDVEHIKLLGSDYTEGMTYRQAYSKLAPQLALKRENSGQKFDCADFTVDVMIEFAYMFKLPVHFEDNKPAHSKGKTADPTLDNDNGGYYDRAGKWVAIKDGDWQALANAIKKDYNSYDIWTDDNKFTINITPSKKPQNGDFQPGDIISIQWEKVEGQDQHYHAQLIVEIYWENGTYIIKQGNTDSEQKPTKVEKRKNAISKILKKIVSSSSGIDKEPAKSLKVKQWNFEYFDKNN